MNQGMVSPIVQIDVGDEVCRIKLYGWIFASWVVNGKTPTAFSYRKTFFIKIVFGLELYGINMEVSAIDGQGAVDERNDECLSQHLASLCG